MTSQDSQKFIKYILESYVDQPTYRAINKSLKPFQDWARTNDMNSVGDQLNLSHMEEMKLQAGRYAKGLNKLKSLDKQDYYRLFMNADVFFETGGFFLNPSAFTKTIEMLGDDQQVKQWVEKVLSGKVIGAYAQTELGHGSNVQGLETEARYDEKSQTWTFNSPKASSAKFWPGLLGIYCTSVVLQAQTFVKNKSIGVQTFAFDIRDQNLNNLSGVDAGEMGAKLGMAFLDHGYLLFQNFKQPRNAMLMRYVKVLEDGTIEGLENKQALKYGYGSMLNLRVFLTNSFGSAAYKNLRNATNYFTSAHLLENPQVRELLLNGFSISLAIIIANKQTGRIFNQFTRHMQAKEYENADKLLNECHIISSTLKAVTGWKTMEISKSLLTFNSVLALRNTFIPRGFTDMVPSVTYEGDNSVLLQLTSRYLLKQEDQEVVKPENINSQSFDSLVSAFEYVYNKQLQRNKLLMSKDMEKGMQLLQIWNQSLQSQLLNLSKLWGRYILAKFYNQSYKQYQGPSKDLLYKIGLTFIHSLINDCKELFYFHNIKISKVNCTQKFTQSEYEMLRSASHWATLPKYELATEGMQNRMQKIEDSLIRARL